MHGASGTSTVLVVEDNSEVRALYSEVLRNDGYRVLEAANGALALSVLFDRPGDVDVILTDLRMASEALAQLERWCRGDADYGDELALTLALRRATGATA